jgi:hypothetical protein
MRIGIEDVMFVMVDIQDRFRGHIPDMKNLVRNASILNKGAELLDIPLLITEQYPIGLGPTLEEIYTPQHARWMDKTSFSIFEDEIEEFIKASGKEKIILYGIEAHICITQSVLVAREKELIPIVVEDAVSSISQHNKNIALKRIQENEGIVVSTEMLLFELLQTASHPDFREISKIVKLGVN